MNLKVIPQTFAICKINDPSQINWNDPYCFIGKTDEELSLVCSDAFIPQDSLSCDTGWRGFRIEGVLDFSLIGILSKLSAHLAQQEIGIFAISTYNTDYILVKEKQFAKAIATLTSHGYTFVE